MLTIAAVAICALFALTTLADAADKKDKTVGRLLSGKVLDRDDNPVPNAVVKSSGHFTFGVDNYPWPDYNSEVVTWGEAPNAPNADALDIKAENIASVTIDPKRAKIDCKARINVHSDGPIQVHVTGCAKPNIVVSP